MSVTDLHDIELVWPSLGPADVIVTGTFDQWSASIHLAKGDAGFFGTVKVPWGQKVTYKFIVDGLWRCRDDRPQEDDGHGNINNVLRTSEKPLPPVHDPPARLFIPLESEGVGDVEAMVTAVEFLPPPEPVTIRGPFPLPIPQISVDGLGQAPSSGTSVSESKLNTAVATEGHVSPTSETPTKPASFTKAPSSCDVPIDDSGHASVNGSGEAHGSHSLSTHPPVQSTKGELPTVSETMNEAALIPQSLPQAAQDTPALTNHADIPPTMTPAAVSEPSSKDFAATAAQGRCQQISSPASVGQASTSSTPASSTLIHKKRRSLFAMIKRIFDKDKDKQVKKEKNKH